MSVDPRWQSYKNERLNETLANIKFVGTSVETVGLFKIGAREISIDVRIAELLSDARDYLTTLVRYIADGNRIVGGQTVACGSWLLRLDENANGFLAASEYISEHILQKADASLSSSYREGAEFAISLWASQTAKCVEVGSDFAAPSLRDFVWVSDDAFKPNMPLLMSRAMPSGRDCGWWLIGNEWDRNPSHVKRYHLEHAILSFPQAADYFALGSGFEIRINQNDIIITFDKQLSVET